MSSLGDGLRLRNDHCEQVSPLTAAINIDLADEGVAAGKSGFQAGNCDKLALCEFEHIVAAINIDDLVRPDLGHDVAGLVIAFFVEDCCCYFRPFEVSGHHGC